MNEKVLNLDAEKQRLLAGIANLSYNADGLEPTEVKWCVTLDQMRKIVTLVTKPYLDDLLSVYHKINERNGSMDWYVWIPSDSKHITSNELRNDQSAIKRSMTKFDGQIKEFMDKYAIEKKMIPSRRIPGARDAKGVHINLEKICATFFDEAGVQYGKIVGNEFRRKSRVETTSVYGKDRDRSGGPGKLLYIEVVKKASHNRFASEDYQPARSFNA